jgi:cysteinyl-tRNA synthetase
MHVRKPPQSITLYDTYLKQIVEIQPDETVTSNTLKIYRCGPTVYFYQHIGNAAGAWLTDTIVNIAQLANWKVEHVENITDVGHLVGDGDDGKNVSEAEDKLEKGAKRDGKTVQEIVNFYTEDYRTQCLALNIQLPNGKYNPKATEYIQEQMILALDLLIKNRAYILDDGIYFDSEANQDLITPFNLIITGDSQFTGRNIINTTKNPADFALWKFVDEKNLQKWRFADYTNSTNSQFNESIFDLLTSGSGTRSAFENQQYVRIEELWGCPGWHSECVAMICSILGNKSTKDGFSFSQFASPKSVIDIHIGGEDHIDIHHRNEILQSEALGFHLSKNWVHNKFVMVDGKKMAKSVGNVYTVIGDKEITGFESIQGRGFDPLSYRMMLFEHHYTQQMDFRWDKLTQSQTRLYNLRKECAKVTSFWKNMKENGQTWEWNMEEWKTVKKGWRAVLLDNINTPEFLNKYTEYLLQTTNRIQKVRTLSKNAYNVLYLYDLRILKLDLFPKIPQEIVDLANQRQSAKSEKDYTRGDEIRAQISTLGWQVDDLSWGYSLWLKI